MQFSSNYGSRVVIYEHKCLQFCPLITCKVSHQVDLEVLHLEWVKYRGCPAAVDQRGRDEQEVDQLLGSSHCRLLQI